MEDGNHLWDSIGFSVEEKIKTRVTPLLSNILLRSNKLSIAHKLYKISIATEVSSGTLSAFLKIVKLLFV